MKRVLITPIVWLLKVVATILNIINIIFSISSIFITKFIIKLSAVLANFVYRLEEKC